MEEVSSGNALMAGLAQVRVAVRVEDVPRNQIAEHVANEKIGRPVITANEPTGGHGRCRAVRHRLHPRAGVFMG